MRKRVGLDFETYSAVDLKKHGLHRYINHPTFRPLIARVVAWDSVAYGYQYTRLDFVNEYDYSVTRLRDFLRYDVTIVAHNAPFEQAVLGALGMDVPSLRFVDSAVVARALGYAGKLEAAAPQMLGTDKLEQGAALIKLFSVPGKYQEASGSLDFDPQVVVDHPVEWQQFGDYCEVDAELGLRIADEGAILIPDREWENQAVTMDMSNLGWPVDLDMVHEMQRRYEDNMATALAEFRTANDAEDLNLNSLKQMKEWCQERGIKAKAFNEQAVARLLTQIRKKLDRCDNGEILLTGQQYNNYCQVVGLLETKQVLGGAALKKLQVLLNTTGEDGRLHDQYLHIGAGQTWRTTGRGVQMQNLKKFDGDPDDVAELEDQSILWDNSKLAQNMRQLFAASHPDGVLIVGDFKSVEARGLAWLAGAVDTLDAFRAGKDMYKVEAAKMFSVSYDQVTDAQRKPGKVAVLSCGYGAGGPAVQEFAEKMGIEFSEAEAAKLVSDWRASNPQVLRLWQELDTGLHSVLDRGGIYTIDVGPPGTAGWSVMLSETATPDSLQRQHKGAQSIKLELFNEQGVALVVRYFHGCYLRGRDICYYKPSELKNGDLWRARYTNPKTKQIQFYKIYGGKLAGILTQSFCREIFFESLRKVHSWCSSLENVDLIGQFHDEIVLDWQPCDSYDIGAGRVSLGGAKSGLDMLMSDTVVPKFPLAADVKHDHRYTK